jgi:PAS domain S-box
MVKEENQNEKKGIHHTTLSSNGNDFKIYSQLLNLASNALLIGDLDQDKIVFANTAAGNLYGYSIEEIMHIPLTNICPELDKVTLFSQVKKQKYTTFHHHKKGKKLSVNVKIDHQPLINQSTVAISIKANSPEEKTISKLVAAEKKYEQLFNLPSIGIAIISNKNLWLEANQKALEIIGYPKKELIGKPCRLNYLTGVSRKEEEDSNAVKKKGNEASTILQHWQKKNKTNALLDITTNYISNSNGQLDYYLLIIKDITYRQVEKQQAELHQKNYKLLVENQTDLIVKVDNQGHFLFVSPSYCNTFGKSEDQLLGKNFMPLVHKDDKESTAKSLASIYFPPHISYHEQRAKTKEGWRWIAWSNNAVLNSKSEVVAIIGVGRDITSQKMAEQKLQESEERFRQMINLLPQPVLETNSNGLITFTNQYFRTEFGYSTNDFQNRININQLISKEELKRARKFLFHTSNNGHESNAFLLLRKDGTQFPAIVNKAAIIVDDKKIGLRIIITNISEQKANEDKIRQSENNYRTIFELASDSILIHNYIDGAITDGNRNAIQSYGLSTLDELKQYSYWNQPPYSYKEAMHYLNKTKEGTTQRFEWKNVRKDGTIFWEEVQLSKVMIQNIPQIISISRDITERRRIQEEMLTINQELKERNEEYAALNEEYIAQNEELLQAKDRAVESDRLKSAFLANMSHEIRTPMNAILGFAGLLAEPNFKQDKQQHFASIIKQRSLDLLKIIDDILDISKIEANQLKLQPANGKISQMLNDLFDLYCSKQIIGNKPNIIIRLNNQLTPNDDEIFADFGRLKQILVNLIENSWKFINTGYIEFGCEMTKPDNLLFFVKDTGIGIPEEKQELIFHRYRQAHDSLPNAGGGTGLGLTISKGIVELMGGSMWLESKVDQGSTFYFSIPRKTIKKSTPPLLTKREKDYQLDNLKILVIEDDKYNAEYIEQLLRSANTHPTIASDGAKGIEFLTNGYRPNIILLDVRLPDINGLELIPLIRKIIKRTPIIAQTAYATEEDRQNCLSAGCTDYIAKPISKEKLLTLIGKHTKKKNG